MLWRDEGEAGKTRACEQRKRCYVGELPSIGQPTLQPQAWWLVARVVSDSPHGSAFQARINSLNVVAIPRALSEFTSGT